MTNLSKELCEICGIKPKKVEKRCKECNLNMEECGCFDCYKEIYPDFEQAENFVKLQKLLIEIGMGFDIQLFDYPTKLQIRFCWDDENFTFKIFGDSLEEVFLRFAIQICELDDEGDIKLAIREAEWVYDR